MDIDTGEANNMRSAMRQSEISESIEMSKMESMS